MALRNIVQDGDAVLKAKCRPVENFDERLAQLLDDMGETMLDSDGLGLAAPQVGVRRRVFVALEESADTQESRNGTADVENAGNSESDENVGKGVNATHAEKAENEPAQQEPARINELPATSPGGRQEEESLLQQQSPAKILEFVNPEIIQAQGQQRGYEGCLSFPGKFGAISRPATVKMRAYTREGLPFEYEASEMLARCLCHEYDHLNGVTIDDLAEYFYDPENPRDLDEEFETDEKTEV